MKRIIREYRRKDKETDIQRKLIKDKIELRKKQIVRLEKKLRSIEYISWIDEVLEKIAKALLRHYPNYTYEILGPFGICSETSIHFKIKGWDKLKDEKQWMRPNLLSITFIPMSLSEGICLGIRDHSKNTGKYKSGSLGEMNGMNHPTIQLKNSTTIKELLKYIK